MRARKRVCGVVALVVACVLAGCREEAEGPIYSVPVDEPEATELTYELKTTIVSGLAKLNGIAVDGEGRLYAVGVGGVRVLDAEGKLVEQWARSEAVQCVAVGSDGMVYLGSAGLISKLDKDGKEVASWDRTGSGGEKLGLITSLAVRGIDLLAADFEGKCVHRFTIDGDYSNVIGTVDAENGSEGLRAPSPHLECAFDSAGDAVVTNPGRLRVETYGLDGTFKGCWGRAGMEAEGFCGCCNPTDIAITSKGYVVTAEKGIFRVKVYEVVDGTGRMLSFISPRHFSKKAAGLDVAVGEGDDIYVADPGDGTIRVFRLKESPVEAGEKR